jgi:hypothetical protein
VPTNHPHHGSPVQPQVAGILAVCAVLFGAALLFIDVHAGAVGHRGLLLAVGLASMAAALVLAVSGALRRR